MSDLIQLTACVSQLAAQAGRLAAHCRQPDSSEFSVPKHPKPILADTTNQEILEIKESVASTVAELRTLLLGPTQFLKHLAYQNQLLACLRWLGEFHILAFIPLDSSVSFEDIADLAGVPIFHLCRIVRMTATAGFLHEPQHGCVAHTALSAPFAIKPSYIDAIMFLSDIAAPAALQMNGATQRHEQSNTVKESAFNIAQGTTKPFVAVCEEQPQLKGQWLAYLHLAMGDLEKSGVEALKSLGCFDGFCGSARSIVESGAETAGRAMALAKLYPNLHFTVQMIMARNPDNPRRSSASEDGSRQGNTPGQRNIPLSTRITVGYRAAGTRQTIRDASLYILNVSSITLGPSVEQITAELGAHMELLRYNNDASLVLTTHVIPEVGILRPEEEAMARLRDLCFFQLAGQKLMDISELTKLVNSMNDSTGRLLVVKKAFSEAGDAAALEVRYQSFASS